MEMDHLNPRLRTNLQALEKSNPILAGLLLSFEPNKNFEVFVGEDPININIIDKRDNTPMYLAQPIDETLKKVEEFKDYSLYPFLYFFGMGNGVFYKILLDNPSHKQIIIFEPELELLYIALNFADFSEEIKSGRLLIFYTQILNYADMVNCLATNGHLVYFRLYDLHVLNNFYGKYKQDCVRVNQIMTRAIEHLVTGAGNDSRDALMGLQNHIANLPELIRTPSLLELVKKVKNTDTAIIVSTGPSLAKQLPLLKQIAPYATLLCIDASFPILYAHGITPDVVLTLERVQLTSEFYTRTPQDAQRGVIFALTSIVHKDTTDAITEGVKTFSMRPFGYTRFFNLKEYGFMGIGMSAANMAYELAVYAAFNRCIFIGQDLAFAPDGSSHSQGFTLGEEHRPVLTKDEAYYIEAYGGVGQVRTTLIWKMFLNFFEQDIAASRDKLEVINSTEGGARIHGALELPFREAVAKIDTSKVKSPIYLDYPTQEKIEENSKKIKEKIIELLEFAFEKKKRVEEVFLRVVKLTEELEKLNRENNLENIDFTEVDAVLDDIDEIKNMFLTPQFIQIFNDAVQSYIIHQELEIAKLVVQPALDAMAKRAKQIDWIYKHKFWLFSLAGGMDAVLEIAKRSAKTWMEIPQKYEDTHKEN